jgi:hypothetical protein
MKNLHLFDAARIKGRQLPPRFRGYAGDHTCGLFEIPSPIDKAPMRVMASSDCGWEHVSVSRRNRCPNWTEMSHVKNLFFNEDETVMQLHVPASDHVNDHPYCLHLWRPKDQEIPRPPFWMVGGCSEEEALEELKKMESASSR